MRRLASCLLVAGLALVGAGCGSSKKTVVVHEGGSVSLHVNLSRVATTVPKGVRVGPGPFVLNGGSVTGGESGLSGDGGSGPGGTSLGCSNGRRYTDAFGIQNSTKAPVTLISAMQANPDARIVGRTVVQLRLSPPWHPTETAPGDLVYRMWSAKPSGNVTIPAGRIATVQRDFLLRNCNQLRAKILIPGSLVLRYHSAGHAATQRLTTSGEQIVVGRGPTRHTCNPVAGSGSLVATDVSCAFARHAAPLCRRMRNESFTGCTVDGKLWDCGRFAGPGWPLLETCYLPHQKAHWFTVVWIGPGLGIWGSIRNRRANPGWNRIDAWHTTRGICEDRPAGLGFVFESSALRILTGKYAARVPADARVKFVLPHFAGRGRFSADASTVQVLIQSHGSYVARAGRLTVTHADAHTISGNVYATLRQKGGTKQSQLNGTWSCPVGTG
jgi:hypothetical protein